MTTWQEISQELDAWATAGRPATFWWRDDDATEPTPALDRLLAIARRYATPLTLAVIPARAQPALAEALAGQATVRVVQHGWAHLNHRPPGEPKAELGPDRPIPFMLGELGRGSLFLDRLFGDSWLRILVPPYNRACQDLVQVLPLAGYQGLSRYDARGAGPSGLVQVNTHVDIMEWSRTRAFLGEAEALSLTLDHLRARRAGTVDAAEPTGLLTHHLAHDEPAWAFIERFVDRIAAHRAVRWVSPEEAFRT